MRIAAIALIVLGTIVGIGGLVVGITRVVHDIAGAKTYETPADIHAHLGTGTWEIYVEDSLESGGDVLLSPSDVIVTGRYRARGMTQSSRESRAATPRRARFSQSSGKRPKK